MADDQRWHVASPSGGVRMGLTFAPTTTEGSRLRYTVTFDGTVVITDSPLGLTLEGEQGFTRNLRYLESRTEKRRSAWTPPWGDQGEIRDDFDVLTLVLEASDRVLEVECRAYDEGVAMRLRLETGDWNGSVITRDDTEFHFPEGCDAYEEHGTEGEYAYTPIAAIEPECQIPLTVVYPTGIHACVAEAGVFDHAQMLLSPVEGNLNALACRLAGPMRVSSPFQTPWRVIMVAKSPGALNRNHTMILNLNPPCALPDTSWIKPGKVLREVTLSTEGGKACVDFARRHNLQYIMYDSGWYGPERDPGSDATKVNVDPRKAPPDAGPLDLHEVIAYARTHDIGVILYVNRLAMERQLDEILPLYARWGVKGIKLGFVNVGTQEAMALIHRAVRLAAEYGLVVNIHDAYRPSGMSRTYPNLLTQEGVRGNEHMPTARHNASLPFTRFTTGAADCTICYYDPRIKTTHAHQLAISVIFFSPLQSLFWYDRPSAYQGEPEIEFFEAVPTVWDRTEVIHDAIGEHATLARKSGERWFVGSITNEHARDVSIPLSFLDPGKVYEARLYRDCDVEEENRTGVRMEVCRVTRQTHLKVQLFPSGGAAVMLTSLPAADGAVRRS